MITRFVIHSPFEETCFVTVKVYEDIELLREAGRRYHSWEDGFEDTIGMVQPAPTVLRYHDDGTEEDVSRREFAGTMRLATGHITPEVVYHEVFHAACAIFRRRVRKNIVLGTDCGTQEEDIADLVGSLSEQLTDELTKRNLWTARR